MHLLGANAAVASTFVQSLGVRSHMGFNNILDSCHPMPCHQFSIKVYRISARAWKLIASFALRFLQVQPG